MFASFAKQKYAWLHVSWPSWVLRYGFFNTDPHPGNLAVDDGYPGGRLIMYDFGQDGVGLLEMMNCFVMFCYECFFHGLMDSSWLKHCKTSKSHKHLTVKGIDPATLERLASSRTNKQMEFFKLSNLLWISRQGIVWRPWTTLGALRKEQMLGCSIPPKNYVRNGSNMAES